MHRRYLNRALLAAALMTAAPARGDAQVSCDPGPLSAYLNTAGIGCSLGGLVVNQFAGRLAAGASDFSLNPFTLQGPPGFIWLGFNVVFSEGTTLPGDRPFGFSFWTSGSPIFGLMAQQQLGPNANTFSALRTNVKGDGGVINASDRYRPLNGSLVADHRACGPGTACSLESMWHGSALTDADGRYHVTVSPVLGGNGAPNDYSVALLVQTSSVTPEPATLLLVASGLGAAGAVIRRRRK